MTMNGFKLFTLVFLSAGLMSCSPTNGGTSEILGEKKVLGDQKVPEQPNISEVNLKTLDMNITAGSPVYMVLPLKKSTKYENGWIIGDVDKHIRKSRTTFKDPEIIVENWGNAPKAYTVANLSYEASMAALQRITNTKNSGLKVLLNDKQAVLKIESETGKKRFDKWASQAKQTDLKDDELLLDLSVFEVVEMVSAPKAVDMKGSLVKQCRAQKKIEDVSFYAAKIRLKPAQESFSASFGENVVAHTFICEGFLKKSQHAIKREITVLGFEESAD